MPLFRLAVISGTSEEGGGVPAVFPHAAFTKTQELRGKEKATAKWTFLNIYAATASPVDRDSESTTGCRTPSSEGSIPENSREHESPTLV
jgi:hypothetical protein